MRSHRAVLCVILLSACTSHKTYTYSGTLQAPSAAIGSTIGGRVVAVYAREGDKVQRGEVLLRFDAKDERAALASAEGRLAQARAVLADLEAGARTEDLSRAAALARGQLAEYDIARSTQPYERTVAKNQLRQALAQLIDARATAEKSTKDAERIQSLFATGDVSAQQRDAAVAAEASGDAQLANRIAAVRVARARAGNTSRVTLPGNATSALSGYRAAEDAYRSLAAAPRPDQVRQAKAAVRVAEADVASARARSNEMLVRSPSDGTVTALDLHAGDLIAPGASIATIDEPGNPYARVYVPQDKLGEVKIGARLEVRADSVSGARFEGIVEQVDDRAQFTPQD
ncbi:MAG: HlyD family secretion protein, partial [Vulcanimicrobiaceae bacterium]